MTANRFRILLLTLATVLFISLWAAIDVPPLSVLRDWADSTGPWFPVLFWLMYVGITQLPIPRTVMTLSAGVLFGTGWGILIAVTATTVSAAISLLIVRGLLRDWIAPRLTHPTVQKINTHLEQRGWVAVISLRMIAAVPFSVLNYAAALTKIKVVPFTVATLIGSAPGTVVTVLFGDTLTGQANPIVVVATVVLAVIGIIGLIVDARSANRQGQKVD
ncbi:TVP38/TMEM64 family protein [Corynebacterium lubricantis]|uniref:TVP38/TMEM64 family protein n=1 Tax=Corynebacterium lubricantis TaxID=541095 RepID=UPI0003608C4D|nr:TVP38/TMEM64 family protein [Corynebacterium lubricantis]